MNLTKKNLGAGMLAHAISCEHISIQYPGEG